MFERLADLDFAYLTTIGRKTGRRHRIEIWFSLHGSRVYLLSGGGDAADWVKNIRAQSSVNVRIGDTHFEARGRIVAAGDEDALARRIVAGKYRPRYAGDLDDWERTALPVAIDLET